jgi:CheY-like chemotaxis protein
MPGTTLASHARSRFPDLNVIFAMAEVSEADADTFGATRTLVKPFTFEQLAAAITPATSRKAE